MHTVYSVRDIGQAIRVERKAQGYTQTEFAELCGVSLSFISSLENGKATTEAGKMIHVVNMLGIDVLLKKRGA